MQYVYLLNSIAHPDQRYVGFTSNLEAKLKSHKSGAPVHTAKYRPWELTAYFAFKNERKARGFEYYLKTGSGKAFSNERFW